MDSHAVVEKIVQNLSFEVEAVPKNKTLQLTSFSKNTPLNVKIRVRKKSDLNMRRGVISIPKFEDTEVPQKIRLVNSDQTIMSFDVFMEAEFEKKPLRKPRKHLFDMLKPGICLGAADNDDYPYKPSSSYSANTTEGNANSRSDGVLKHNFTLSKNTYDEYVEPTKGKTFLGKCKPGGCLDPPFCEEKYSYKPIIRDPLPDEENNLKKDKNQDSKAKDKESLSSIFDSGMFKKKRKTGDQSSDTRESNSMKGNHSNSILNLYQVASTVNSFSTTQSNSVMTYPHVVTSSELPINDEKNRSTLSSEDKSRKSYNEFTETYFIPPKGMNKMRDKKKDIKIEIDELQEYDKEKIKSKPIETIKMPMPIPVNINSCNCKSEIVKSESAAVDFDKANAEDIDSLLNDSRVSFGTENDADKDILRSAEISQQEIGEIKLLPEDPDAIDTKFITTNNFDEIKNSPDEKLSLVVISSHESGKLVKQVSLDKNASIDDLQSKENPINTHKRELNDSQISEIIIPPTKDVEMISMDENTKETYSIEEDSLRSNISSLKANNLDTALNSTQGVDLKEKWNQSEMVTHSIENTVLNFLQSESPQESSKLSEPTIYQPQDVNFNKSDSLHSTEETMLIPTDIEKINMKSIDEEKISLQSDHYTETDRTVLSADRSSQINWPIQHGNDIKEQVQSSKDIENVELSTDELISENRSNIMVSAEVTTDTDNKKIESVDSETNLVGEHINDTVNQVQNNDDVNDWKPALRTEGTDVVDDYDSSPSTSIKSKLNKGVMSPEKQPALPIFNTVSTETISKPIEIPNEPKILSNELDKTLSNFGKDHVRTASVSSPVPSNSTLKSVLKKDTVAVDLAFQSYVNDKNERVLKTLDTTTEPKRYLNDSITLVKSQVRLSANEIRIPIDSENDMLVHIKKASVSQHVHISESELETVTKHGRDTSDSQCQHEMIDRDFLHNTLLEIYDQELVPLQMIIKSLRDEIDILASQQTVFKDKIFNSKRSKPSRIINSTRRCGCLKKT